MAGVNEKPADGRPEDGADDRAALFNEMEAEDRKAEGEGGDADDHGDGRADGGDDAAQAKADAQPPKDEPKAGDGAAKEPAAEGVKPDPHADVLSTLAPEARAAVQGIIDEHMSARRRAEGTVSGLTKSVNKLTREVGELKAQAPAGKPATEGKDARPASDRKVSLREHPKVKDLLRDYSDIAEPILAVLDDVVGPIAADMQRVRAVHREQDASAQEAVVLKHHSDFDAAASSAEFRAWYENLDTADPLRKVVEENGDDVVNGMAVKRALDAFKADTGWKAPKAGDDPPPPPPKDNPRPSPDGSSQQKLRTTARRGLQLAGASSLSPRKALVDTGGNADDADKGAIWDEMERAETRGRSAA